ncbi:MAG: (Fe-S)-binding protein [Thermoplasmata archaeon]|nr:MAG: (Fe-S)-binding protein [Thermoplasmata archaeon]
MADVQALIDDTGAYDCVECGKCTSVCPAAIFNPDFAPRLIVVKAIEGIEGLASEKDIWSCMTCEMCSDMCPYKVDYAAFIQGLRAEAVNIGTVPVCSQGGLVQTIGRIMTSPNLKQNRLNWLEDDLKVASEGEVYYFTGCLAHLQDIFEDRNANCLDIAKSTIKLLNKAGITPVLSNEEVCCGHDLLWTGDEKNFEKLMEKNLKAIKATGAKTILFSCPECYRTFDVDYQDMAGDLDFELVHTSDFLLDLIEEGKLKFNKLDEKVTYHDPCRLGRHMGIYESPRKLLEAAGIDLVEMERTSEKSMCCGVSAFVSCEAKTRKMQLDRLKEAKATETNKLLTYCPKCQIHMKCATWKNTPIQKEEVEIPIEDLVSLLARAVE